MSEALVLLQEAEKHLSGEDRLELMNIFIGALSVAVGRRVWGRCLKEAEESSRRMRLMRDRSAWPPDSAVKP